MSQSFAPSRCPNQLDGTPGMLANFVRSTVRWPDAWNEPGITSESTVTRTGTRPTWFTSRPALLGAVARMTRHGGQCTIKISLQHDKKELLVGAIQLVSKTLRRFYLIAERWSIKQRWTLLLTHIFRHWLGGKWLGALPEGAQALLSG